MVLVGNGVIGHLSISNGNHHHLCTEEAYTAMASSLDWGARMQRRHDNKLVVEDIATRIS